MKNRWTACLALGGLLAIQGCGAPSKAIDPEARARVATSAVQAPAQADFPDMGNAKWKQGAFPNLENLRKMAPGTGKDQVRALLGWPHFSEGLWGVTEWNYIFHFRTTAGAADHVTCQYMVRFTSDGLATGGWWKPATCSAWVNPPAIAAVTALPSPVSAQKVTLGADGLFRFDGAALADLLPEGRAQIERLAQDIQSNFKVLKSVRIVGHTDRLGTDAYNDALSQQRADTVRALMTSRGLDGKRLVALGRGKREPVTSNCKGAERSEALIACLQPDRRVEIEVLGEQ